LGSTFPAFSNDDAKTDTGAVITIVAGRRSSSIRWRDSSRLSGLSNQKIQVCPKDLPPPLWQTELDGRSPMSGMKRREFITLIGGATAWPLAARGQQPERMRRVVALLPATSDDPDYPVRVGAFLQGLQEAGWGIGRNMRFDTRWAGANPVDIAKHVAEVVALAPDVILAYGNSTLRPLLQATHTIPIVFPVAAAGSMSMSRRALAGVHRETARPGADGRSFQELADEIRRPGGCHGPARTQAELGGKPLLFFLIGYDC
jgi:hypothetical protein